MAESMKVVEIRDRFGIDHLTLGERPVPQPGDGEVLVRLKAASLNFRDFDVVGGARAVSLPLIPVSDGAGEVVAVGRNVTTVAVGDRVCPLYVQGWIGGDLPAQDVVPTLGGPLDGVLRDYGVWPESGVVRFPDFLTDAEAATLPCAAVSAWNAVMAAGRCTPGSVVVLQGTGGVSLFALQFAKAAGATVILTSGSDEKLERGRALGADHGINYRTTPDWGAAVKRLTGTGADLVVDIGGVGTLGQSAAALRNGGRISAVGFVGSLSGELNIGPFLMKGLRLRFIRVGNRTHFEAMAKAIAQHRLRPVVDRVFPFAEIRDAFRHLQAAGHFGKVCIGF